MLTYLHFCADTVVKELTEEQHHQAVENEYNFDCPDAFDTKCMVNTLRRLKEGKSVEIPVYNFTTHKAEKKKVQLLAHFHCLHKQQYRSLVFELAMTGW